MINKKKIGVEVAVVILIALTLFGTMSFTGYYIYEHLKPVLPANSSQPYISLKFLATDVIVPIDINNTGDLA